MRAPRLFGFLSFFFLDLGLVVVVLIAFLLGGFLLSFGFGLGLSAGSLGKACGTQSES
jgi:hypothetical protein